MSNRIKGITIELDGDTRGLDNALKDVNKQTRNTQNELREVERALKFEPGNTELIAQQQQLLAEQIQNTSQKLDVLRTAQQQVQQQFERGEISGEQYRAFNRELIRTESQLQSLEQRLDESGRAAEESGTDFKRLGETVEKAGDKMKGVGESLSKNVSAPLAAFGTGAILSAAQFDNAAGQIQAALGTTAEEAEKLENIATSVWKEGFGESLEEVSNGLIRVKQNIQGVSDSAELERITRDALALAKTFDSDVNEVTRAGNNLMVNFGISSEEAFDMMAKGAQNGLNFSNEMFDNLAEYAPLWADMGYSAEEMFGILEAGAENGVYNLDYLNDVMKEFQILATDGSKATTDAVSALGPEVEKVWEAFSNGEATVADMSQIAVTELAKIDDKVKQNELGVALFGTKWEDLGGDVVLSMLASGQALEGFEGTMNNLAETQEQTFGQRWESFTRTAAASLEPLGKILLDLAEDWLPKVISVVEKVAKWFSDLSPIMQKVVVVVGAIAAAIGPMLVVMGSVISAVGKIIPLFAKLSGAGKLVGTVIGALSGPIGIAIAAITAIIAVGVLLYKNWDTVKLKANELWTSIKNAFQSIKSAIEGPINAAKSTVLGVITAIKTAFSNMSLKLPEIKLPKLPKFSLTGNFSLNPPSVPKLNVKWNALGGIFNKPTILNSRAGLQGVGEAGSEAILPLNAETLAGIGKGIAEQMGNGMPSTIVVQSILDGRVVAQSVTPFISQNQYNTASLAGLTKGVSL